MRLLLLAFISISSFSPDLSLASDSFNDLLGHLEYDQEIRGLFIPGGYTESMSEDLYIGSAKIRPDGGKLYCLGWRPALHLEQVRYGGSWQHFLELTKTIAKKSRSSLYLRSVQTKDRQEGFCCLVTPEGGVRIGP